MLNDFYVYIHLKKTDKTIFYVGKGKNNRAFDFKYRNKLHKRIVSKHGCLVEIVEGNLSESSAFRLESQLIKKYKKMGLCVANFTEGGEGLSGYKHKLESKRKTANTLRGTKHTKIRRDRSSKTHNHYSFRWVNG